jgi:repressor LexA
MLLEGLAMSLFSDRLYTLRKENNLSQEELANNLNSKYGMDTNKGTISKYEKGIHVPGFTFVDNCSDYFGVTSDYLMGRSDNKYYADNLIGNKIPIIGTIAAGGPITAVENIIGYEYCNDNCSYCLKVKGDSMTGARILDGDIVFIYSQPDVEHGEIAAIMIDDEVTLKRVLKINGTVILHPENPSYKDLVFSRKDYKQLRILGKVKYFKAEVK